MYIPPHFAATDAVTLAELIDAHSFGVLVTVDGGKPFASHLPFLYDQEAGVLHCHVARANPQWRHFESSPDALAIFAGPHAYVSPTWYVEAGVPTWNYAVVHVSGVGRAVDDATATARHVEALAAKHERGNTAPWVPSYDPRRLAGIVGIEIRIRAIEGKFKLSRQAATKLGATTQSCDDTRRSPRGESREPARCRRQRGALGHRLAARASRRSSERRRG